MKKTGKTIEDFYGICKLHPLIAKLLSTITKKGDSIYAVKYIQAKDGCLVATDGHRLIELEIKVKDGLYEVTTDGYLLPVPKTVGNFPNFKGLFDAKTEQIYTNHLEGFSRHILFYHFAKHDHALNMDMMLEFTDQIARLNCDWFSLEIDKKSTDGDRAIFVIGEIAPSLGRKKFNEPVKFRYIQMPISKI